MLPDGASVLFLGDSITAADPGYTRLVAAMFAVRRPRERHTWLYQGVSGNKVTDLAARLDRDVLAHHPDWVSVAIGINDVWHGFTPGLAGVEEETFRAVYDRLLHAMTAAGIQLVLVTPTVIGEDLESPENRALAPYAATVRQLAEAHGARLADAHRRFHAALTGQPDHRPWTVDGVHLNVAGNLLLAETLYETLTAAD